MRLREGRGIFRLSRFTTRTKLRVLTNPCWNYRNHWLETARLIGGIVVREKHTLVVKSFRGRLQTMQGDVGAKRRSLWQLADTCGTTTSSRLAAPPLPSSCVMRAFLLVVFCWSFKMRSFVATMFTEGSSESRNWRENRRRPFSAGRANVSGLLVLIWSYMRRRLFFSKSCRNGSASGLPLRGLACFFWGPRIAYDE